MIYQIYALWDWIPLDHQAKPQNEPITSDSTSTPYSNLQIYLFSKLESNKPNKNEKNKYDYKIVTLKKKQHNSSVRKIITEHSMSSVIKINSNRINILH